MVSGSKQAGDLFSDADITQEKTKSFNKCETQERTTFHLSLGNLWSTDTDYRDTKGSVFRRRLSNSNKKIFKWQTKSEEALEKSCVAF